MASRGINKVLLIGNLGQDPETRYMPSGDAMTNIRVATSETWKDKNTGDTQERTEWHSVVFFGRLAEIAAQYLRKGSKVYIEGSLRTRKWQGQDGQDRYTTEIRANEMQMLDSRASGGGGGGGGGGYDQAPMQQSRSQQGGGRPQQGGNSYGGGQQPQRSPAPSQAAAVDEDFDDDIPF